MFYNKQTNLAGRERNLKDEITSRNACLGLLYLSEAPRVEV